MNTPFTYTILRYIHSQVLGEVVNVGILFSFPNQGKVVFKYPESLTRLKGLYCRFSESQIRAYQRGFAEKAAALNAKWKSNAPSAFTKSIWEVTPQDFLVEDATALQFSETKEGFLPGDQTDYIVSQYFELYFGEYADAKETRHKHDEAYLNKKLVQALKTANSVAYSRRFEKNVIIESAKTSLKFDFRWQNGTTNLIKSVGFDLSDESSINDKSILLHGKLNFLGEKAERENLRYDLLVSTPQKRNLFKAFDNALKILDSSTAPKKIITKDSYHDYVEKALEQSEHLW